MKRFLPVVTLILVFAPSVFAIDRFVENTDDTGDDSLRNVLALANDGDVIRFDPGLANQTIALASELVVSASVTIDGTDAPGITISGEDNSRVFNIAGIGKTFLLKRLTMTRGKAADGTVAQHGGAILHGSGTLTIIECTISDSAAGDALSTTTQRNGGSGGGIYSDGFLNIHSSTISGNRAGKGNTLNNDMTIGSGGTGGGIHGNGSEILLENSTVHGNSAGDGGALNGGSAGGAGGNGGGIHLIGPNGLTVRNSTITGNTAGNADPINNSVPPGSGGGIFCNTSPLVVVSNSIIAGNELGTGGIGSASGPDINSVAGVTASGINIVGDNKTVKTEFPNPGVVGEPNVNGDYVGSAENPFDPLLSELGNNGGPTLTRLPLSGSAAIDPPNGATTSSLETDQRGLTRVIATLDVGAVEVQPSAVVVAIVDNSVIVTQIKKKIKKLKKKAKAAKRKGQIAKAKRLKKKFKKFKKKLKSL